MPAKRINVIGASGSGASTVGRALSSALAVTYFDSDDYFHAPCDPPFQKPRSPAERYALITDDLHSTESWVLGGGIAGWTPYPELDFTCVVFLYVPTSIRLERLRRRERGRFGSRIREGGDMHEAHEAFIHWASRYDVGDVEGRTLARHEAYLEAQTCPVLGIRDAQAVSEITSKVLSMHDCP